MSLESYKKTLEAQKEWKREFNPESSTNSEERKPNQGSESIYDETRPRKRHSGCLIFFILIVALFAVSAIKNPSENESKEIVKGFIVEKINNKMRTGMNNEDNDGLKQLGAFLGMAFSSNIIDYFCEIQVNDHIVFSTFDCTAEVDKERKTIVSGVIFLGKLIPLKSDIRKEALDS